MRDGHLGAMETTSDEDVYCEECNGRNGLHHVNCSAYEPVDYMEER